MITVEAIFLGATIHGVALALLLTFNGHSNCRSNLILAALVWCLTLAMWNVHVYRADQSQLPVIIDVYLWATPLLWAPLIYIYTGQLTGRRTATIKRLLLHAAPALFAGLLQIPLHFVQDTETGKFLMRAAYNANVLFIYPQIAVYVWLCLRMLRSYRALAEQQLSATEKINLIWLSALIGAFSFILMCDMALNLPHIFFGVTRPQFYDAVLLAEAGAVFAIGYFSLRQPEIFMGQSTTLSKATSTRTPKYLDSPVDEVLGAELADKLDALMEERQLFLENGLRLSDLAQEAGLSPHHLSQVINQHRHRNFFEYVNTYRARHAANHLLKHGKANLTQLAYDSGFNNRASFNTAFKKYTGMTPTRFLENAATQVTD